MKKPLLTLFCLLIIGFGQEIQSQSNTLLFNVYNDGAVEKKMIVD
jgi:hypothetical protein